jgi:hypothetical protein
MVHNSFDVAATIDGYVATSHNFPNCKGVGKTEGEAINQMERQIQYLQDNNPTEYMKVLRERKEQGLVCACGEKLVSGDKILAIME